ncbi:hypothetical protein ACFQ2B_10070 [Streptomyces stramineus]|uniref:hypothetical protein n=1 Tax=Streptomyces sp. NPDC046215 TaxID=3155774 RepID=UPI0033C62193
MSTPLRDGGAPAPAGIPAAPAPADPVRALLERHRDLCARAVDPLEIAAVLQARGLAERMAAECRHRDVFSLAEELHARARRVETALDAPQGARRTPRARAPRAAGPWRVVSSLAIAWLLTYALVGDAVLTALSGGGAFPALHAWPGALRAAAPTAAALACATVPAAWCARWFASRVRHALVDSRSLAEFRARVRPLLMTALGLFLAALTALLWAAHTALGPGPRTSPLAAAAALGALLFLARLTAGPGSGRAGACAAWAACAAQGAALAAAWLFEGGPAGPYGPAAVPLVACAVPAAALLAHALLVLARASAHRHGPRAPHPTAPADACEDPAR